MTTTALVTRKIDVEGTREGNLGHTGNSQQDYQRAADLKELDKRFKVIVIRPSC